MKKLIIYMLLLLTLVSSAFAFDYVSDSHDVGFGASTSTPTASGITLTPNYDIYLGNATIQVGSTCSKAFIQYNSNSTNISTTTTLSTKTFIFSSPVLLRKDVKYNLLCDNNGASYSDRYSTVVFDPTIRTNVIFDVGPGTGYHNFISINSVRASPDLTDTENVYYDTLNISFDIDRSNFNASFYEYLYTGNVSSYPTKNDGTINGKTFNDETLTNFADTTRINHTGYGKALEFDGVDDYVNLDNDVSLQITDEFSLNMWFKPNALSPVQTLIAKYPTTAQYFIIDYTSATLSLYSRNSSGTSGQKVLSSSSDINLNEWNNLIISINSSNGIIVFLNGIEKTTSGNLYFDDSLTNAGNLEIGRRPAFNDHFFNGSIDEVRIWDKALNITEIQAEMVSTSPVVPTIASYSFNEHEGVTAYDTNHIVEGFDNTSKGMAFDGVDDYVDLGNLYNYEVSISFWFKTTNNGRAEDLMYKYDGATGFFSLRKNADGSMQTQFYDNTISKTVLSGIGYDDNTYHYYSTVLDRNLNLLSLYLDGVLIGSSDISTLGSLALANNNIIGGNLLTGNYYNGSIDNVRIYNDTLTSDEVLDLYNNQYFDTSNLVASYDFEEMQNSLIHDRNRQVCVNCYSSEISYNNLLEGTYTTQVYDELSDTSNTAYFTVDITNPVITNNVPVELNTYTFNDSLFSCSDTNLLSCNIAIDSLTQDQNDNFTLVHNGNLSYTITAIDLAGNTINENGTLFVNPYINFNFTEFDTTPISNFSLGGVDFIDYGFFKVYDLGLGNSTLTFIKDGYKQTNITITVNDTSGDETYIYTVLFARIIINLYNDDTKAIIPTESFSLQLSGPAGYIFTSNGTLFNISDFVIAGTYTGLISSDNYESKEIFFTYTSQEIKELDVYFIPLNLTNIGFVIIEAYKADNTPNKYISTYAKQWFASEGIYKKVQETKTGGDGTAELKIILEDYIYQFCIYTIQNGETCTDDEIIKTTENGKVIPITEESRITTQPSYSELLDFSEDIRVETSNTTGFRNLYLDFSWVDLSGFNLDMCYSIYKDFQYTKELVDSNCVTGATGTFEQIYFLNSSYAYIVKVSAEIDGIVLSMYSNTFQSGKDSETISGVLESKGMQGLALVLYIVVVMTIIALLKDPFKGVVVLFIAIIGINVFFNQLLSPYALSALMSFSGLTAWGLRQIR